MRAIITWAAHSCVSIACAVVLGVSIASVLFESGGSTIYVLGQVHCPIRGFYDDPVYGQYPEITCEGDHVFPMVERSLFLKSALSHRFRIATKDDVERISSRADFVCSKVRWEDVTIINLVWWKPRVSVASTRYHRCDQVQVSVARVVGTTRCRKKSRKCLA